MIVRDGPGSVTFTMVRRARGYGGPE
jgi:hypothetical protein